jgi:hypothetical protein
MSFKVNNDSLHKLKLNILEILLDPEELFLSQPNICGLIPNATKMTNYDRMTNGA